LSASASKPLSRERWRRIYHYSSPRMPRIRAPKSSWHRSMKT